jgi:hypothetical protein
MFKDKQAVEKLYLWLNLWAMLPGTGKLANPSPMKFIYYIQFCGSTTGVVYETIFVLLIYAIN